MNTGSNAAVDADVARLLERSPAYRQLDLPAQREVAEAMSRITGYLTGGGARPVAGQLSPWSDRQQASTPSPGAPAPAASPASPAPSSSGPQQTTTGRVGEVARATLNAIDFPRFVASLIQGTFQAIVDASIQQMEAYAELLKNVTRSVDNFTQENVTDGMARDYLADQYDGVFVRDTSAGQPRIAVNRSGADGQMPEFLKGLGFESAEDIDDEAVDQVIVPATRRSLAERRQQTLATMVLMGLNRVVVDDGEIMAKLQFHIDASETAAMRFDQTKTTSGNMARTSGRSPFTANAIMVNTSSLNAQSDINVRADLTGQVKVRFRSETFPLERFADSAAIQLINQNARVPQPQPAPAAAPAPGAGAPAVTPAPAAPPTTEGAAPAAQSLAADPWAPGRRK